MDRKFRDALKNAYCIPEPSDKDAFFRKLENQTERHKGIFPWLPALVRYAAVPLTALTFLGFYGTYRILSDNKPDFVTEMPGQTTEASSENFCAKTDTSDVTTVSAEQIQTAAALTTSQTVSSMETDKFLLTTTSGSLPILRSAIETTATKTASVQIAQTSASASGTDASSISADTTTITSQTITQTTAATMAALTNSTMTSHMQTTSVRTTTATTIVSAAVTTTPSAAIQTMKPTMNATQTTTLTTTTRLSQDHADVCPPSTTTFPIAGIQGTTSAEPAPPEDPSFYDYRVLPLFQYSVTENIVEPEYSMEDAPIDALLYWMDTANNSDYIVYGEILSVFYTSIDGAPWTQIDIMIEEDWTQCFCFGDMISVYLPGGYMPLTDYIEQNNADADFSHLTSAEIADATLFDPAGRTVFPAEGERYLFFLNSSNNAPIGAFTCTNEADYSICVQNGDGYAYTWNVTSNIFTEEELWEYMETMRYSTDK